MANSTLSNIGTATAPKAIAQPTCLVGANLHHRLYRFAGSRAVIWKNALLCQKSCEHHNKKLSSLKQKFKPDKKPIWLAAVSTLAASGDTEAILHPIGQLMFSTAGV